MSNISKRRQGGLKLPPPIPFTPTSRPLRKGFPPLCSIYIVKCYAILQNFSLFSGFPPSWESRFPSFPSCPLFSWAPAPCPPTLSRKASFEKKFLCLICLTGKSNENGWFSSHFRLVEPISVTLKGKSKILFFRVKQNYFEKNKWHFDFY